MNIMRGVSLIIIGIGVCWLLEPVSVSNWVFAPVWGETHFIRGDANTNGEVDISDAVHSLGYLFSDKEIILDCEAAADVNASGVIDIADPVALLTFLFACGSEPVAPFPDCGEDATGLPCEWSPCGVRVDGGSFVMDLSLPQPLVANSNDDIINPPEEFSNALSSLAPYEPVQALFHLKGEMPDGESITFREWFMESEPGQWLLEHGWWNPDSYTPTVHIQGGVRDGFIVIGPDILDEVNRAMWENGHNPHHIVIGVAGSSDPVTPITVDPKEGSALLLVQVRPDGLRTIGCIVTSTGSPEPMVSTVPPREGSGEIKCWWEGDIDLSPTSKTHKVKHRYWNEFGEHIPVLDVDEEPTTELESRLALANAGTAGDLLLSVNGEGPSHSAVAARQKPKGPTTDYFERNLFGRIFGGVNVWCQRDDGVKIECPAEARVFGVFKSAVGVESHIQRPARDEILVFGADRSILMVNEGPMFDKSLIVRGGTDTTTQVSFEVGSGIGFQVGSRVSSNTTMKFGVTRIQSNKPGKYGDWLYCSTKTNHITTPVDYELTASGFVKSWGILDAVGKAEVHGHFVALAVVGRPRECRGAGYYFKALKIPGPHCTEEEWDSLGREMDSWIRRNTQKTPEWRPLPRPTDERE